MDTKIKTKQLLKILIGAAWLDGTIQPEERQYLHKMVKGHGFADDLEIRTMLAEVKPISPSESYQWLESYLGNHRSQEDYQHLIDAISTLIYSDSNIDTEEAKLLSQLQILDPGNQSSQSVFDQVLKKIQFLYRKAIRE